MPRASQTGVETGTRKWTGSRKGRNASLELTKEGDACEDSCSRSRVAAPTAYDSPAVSA